MKNGVLILKYQPVILPILMIVFFWQFKIGLAAEVSFTFDDFDVHDAIMLTAEARNKSLLEVLDRHHLKATLFVRATYIDGQQGKSLLHEWDSRGHQIGNHSYLHLDYHSLAVSFSEFSRDLIKAEDLLKDSVNFQKLFRFPYLHEGNTLRKRDQFREFLRQNQYRVGHVTIDASDWYINDRMVAKFGQNPRADLSSYRDYYLKHVWDRANFYNNLSKIVLGREVKHTLLLHYNLLNALFLADLVDMFEKNGWKVIAASEAFQDPVFLRTPQIVPAGNSVLWALAKESGKYDSILRDPGEDGDYEKEAMDRLENSELLNFSKFFPMIKFPDKIY